MNRLIDHSIHCNCFISIHLFVNHYASYFFKIIILILLFTLKLRILIESSKTRSSSAATLSPISRPIWENLRIWVPDITIKKSKQLFRNLTRSTSNITLKPKKTQLSRNVDVHIVVSSSRRAFRGTRTSTFYKIYCFSSSSLNSITVEVKNTEPMHLVL